MNTETTRNKLLPAFAGLKIRLETGYLGSTCQGRAKFAYRLFLKNKLIFEGTDYSPSPMWMPKRGWYETLPPKARLDLLFFLTLQPGDTDEYYFKDYTEEQLEFVNSDTAEEIRIILNDLT